MKKNLILLFMAILAISLTSCVENSKKYKALQAQMDSLNVTASAKSAEFEEVFATLNEVESGLQSIREAENILVLQSQKGGAEVNATSRDRLKSDVAAIGEAIANYKKEISKLKNDNRIRSSQFTKRLNALTAELENKSQLIEDLSRQLEEKDNQLKVKTQQISSLDETVSTLRQDVSKLNSESTSQKATISTQDVQINTAYYIVGTKADLISANVMSKGGLFRSAKISYQAEQSAFVKIDIRELSEINLNAKKAKVMSLHPTGTYSLDKDANGMLILKITDPKSFWEQTKYLVIQTQ
jgi:predicted  nucleic acid-binding Zn-ribbon protein